eukprot:m51a1_g5195 hypothetical protein (91) ;mRNA; f:205866-206138
MKLYAEGEGPWQPTEEDLDAFEQVLAQVCIREPDLQKRTARASDKLVERGYRFAVVITDSEICAANSSMPSALWAAYSHEGHCYVIFVLK